MYKSDSAEELIFGTWPVIEAIKAGNEIEKVLIQAGARSPQIVEIINLLKAKAVPFQMVPIEKLNRVTRKNHQGVIAYVAAVTYQKLSNILPMLYEAGMNPFLLVLDRVTDVRNVGAIARSAEAAGVHAIVVPSRGNARLGADAVKTSAGALARMNVCREDNLKTTIQYMKESGVKVVAITEKADGLIWNTNLDGPIALLLGSEEEGISDAYLSLADLKVKIPMLGEIGSLNVSVAAGITCFEVVRQRGLVE